MAISAMIMPLKNWQVSLKSCIRSRCRKAGKTTYNVGTISGGTSVNTIAQEASMLYEFRSDRKVNLAYMKEKFEAAVDEAKAAGLDITYEILGIRPCSGDVDKERQARLLERAKAAVETVTGNLPLELVLVLQTAISRFLWESQAYVWAAIVEQEPIQERNM